jgi:hypothetical protein
MNGYICFYKGQRTEVYAETTLKAQDKAREEFQRKYPRRKIKGSEISVNLAEIDGETVTHTAVD